MLEDAQAEVTEGERGQVRIERADEVLVEPLRFFDLKAYSLYGFQFFLWQIDYEAYTEVIQPCITSVSEQWKDGAMRSFSAMGYRSKVQRQSS